MTQICPRLILIKKLLIIHISGSHVMTYKDCLIFCLNFDTID